MGSESFLRRAYFASATSLGLSPEQAKGVWRMSGCKASCTPFTLGVAIQSAMGKDPIRFAAYLKKTGNVKDEYIVKAKELLDAWIEDERDRRKDTLF